MSDPSHSATNLRRLAPIALLLGWLAWVPCRAAETAPWVLVDTVAQTLTVFAGGPRPLARFRNIATGTGGVADLHRAGDGTTPRGTFHVAWINRHSRFGLFFGLDYPTWGMGARAYVRGLIDYEGYAAIRDAHREGRVPPQDTALGGRIGIHGVGAGDPWVHRHVNWTDGCIALSNHDVATLARWVRLGTKVVVQ